MCHFDSTVSISVVIEDSIKMTFNGMRNLVRPLWQRVSKLKHGADLTKIASNS